MKEQLNVADGKPLTYHQDDVILKGHAIEVRINAEHPYKFTPCPGTISLYHAPGGPGIRMDTHVYTSYSVPPLYDSMIGKLIAYGENRDIAIARMRNALDEIVVEGITCNIPLLQDIMRDGNFIKGEVNIHYLEKMINL